MTRQTGLQGLLEPFIVQAVKGRLAEAGYQVDEARRMYEGVAELLVHKGSPAGPMFSVRFDLRNPDLIVSVLRAGETQHDSGVYRRQGPHGTSVRVKGRTSKIDLSSPTATADIMRVIDAECAAQDTAHASDAAAGMAEMEASFLAAVKDVTFEEGAEVAMGRLIALVIKSARDFGNPDMLADAASFMVAPPASPAP